MRKPIVICLLLLAVLAAPAWAEDFQGAPVMPEGSTVQSSAELLVKFYSLPPEQVLQYYKDALKGEKDIRIREFGGKYIVEEFGSRPWNKVLISKDKPGETTVTISKDSWTWIIGMLFLRFTGVFVVLTVLFIATFLATSIIARALKDNPRKAQ